ncbi:hypothetical protein ZWY2020_016764 [Hordeum vulgare]|nr:hypothetical protein ZWY2020_016764 [Hordeum vulgare]
MASTVQCHTYSTVSSNGTLQRRRAVSADRSRDVGYGFTIRRRRPRNPSRCHCFTIRRRPRPRPRSRRSSGTSVWLTRVSPSRLSGGERRRVSIGLALLRDPGALLLDEPTSGLDSSSAFVVVGCLRAVADARGTTVVMSIHQPSTRLLSAVDSLLLLSRGTVLHHGSLASFDASLLSHGFAVPAHLNPLEYALEVIDQIPHPSPFSPEPKSAQDHTTKTSDHHRPAMATPPSLSCTSPCSRIHEFVVLYKRAWKVVYRSKQLLLTNFHEAVIVETLLGTIYINAGYGEAGVQKRLGLFAFTLTFLLTSTTETLPTFVTERPIVLAETAAGLYRLSSHATAATMMFIPYLLAVALLYSSCVYFLL